VDGRVRLFHPWADNLRRKKKKQQCKVGREEECSSLNRHELAAFLRALRDTLVEEPILYLCDNQSSLKAVDRWVGEGEQATLVGALGSLYQSWCGYFGSSHQDTAEENCSGNSKFFCQKAHEKNQRMREPTTWQIRLSDPELCKEWCQQMNWTVFTWGKPYHEAGKVTYQDYHATFNNSVRDEIRRGSAENEVPKHEEKLTSAWRQIITLKRWSRWCKRDDIEDCTHKRRKEMSNHSLVKFLKQNNWIDDRKFLRSCVQARAEKDNINHPAYGTWTADFILRQNANRVIVGLFERPVRLLETYEAKIDGNRRDHSGRQMACKNQTIIGCRL